MVDIDTIVRMYWSLGHMLDISFRAHLILPTFCQFNYYSKQQTIKIRMTYISVSYLFELKTTYHRQQACLNFLLFYQSVIQKLFVSSFETAITRICVFAPMLNVQCSVAQYLVFKYPMSMCNSTPMFNMNFRSQYKIFECIKFAFSLHKSQLLSC